MQGTGGFASSTARRKSCSGSFRAQGRAGAGGRSEPPADDELDTDLAVTSPRDAARFQAPAPVAEATEIAPRRCPACRAPSTFSARSSVKKISPAGQPARAIVFAIDLRLRLADVQFEGEHAVVEVPHDRVLLRDPARSGWRRCWRAAAAGAAARRPASMSSGTMVSGRKMLLQSSRNFSRLTSHLQAFADLRGRASRGSIRPRSKGSNMPISLMRSRISSGG